MTWRLDQITAHGLTDDETDDPVVTVTVSHTPAGSVKVMGEAHEPDPVTLCLQRVHIDRSWRQCDRHRQSSRASPLSSWKEWAMRPSKLKERFARLGPLRDIDRVRSGSPAAFVLRPSGDLADVKAVTATEILARHGLTLLRAKRSIEQMLEKEEVAVGVPMVDDVARFSERLAQAGLRAILDFHEASRRSSRS